MRNPYESPSPYETVFRQAFEEGCGTPYEAVLRSAMFLEYLDFELTFEAHNDSAHNQIRQNGHLTGGINFHRISQKGDGDLVSGASSKVSPTTLRERALIATLGETLIATARQRLPENMLYLADQWRTLKASEEGTREDFTQILHDLYNRVRRLTDKNTSKKRWSWVSQILNPTFNPERVLPHQMEVFGSGETIPGCLGMTALLLGWAAEAGAPSAFVSIIERDTGRFWISEEKLLQKVLDELDERRIPVSAELRQSLNERLGDAGEFKYFLNQIHAGIAISTEPFQWVHIDPYLEYFGPFGRCWQPSPGVALDVMQNFSGALPGLTAVCHESGQLRQLFERRHRNMERAIRYSREMERLLNSERLTSETLFTTLRHSHLTYLLASWDKVSQADAVNRACALGFDWTEPPSLKEEVCAWQRYNEDLEFQKEVHRRICGGFIRFALRHNMNFVLPRTLGTVPPRSIEVSLPQFQLALHFLNTLRCFGPYEHLSRDWFLTHSSSQLFVHEALDGSSEVTPLLAQGIEMVREYQPYLFPNLRQKLLMQSKRQRERR